MRLPQTEVLCHTRACEMSLPLSDRGELGAG